MTDPHDEHGEILRRALHAEAETVSPSADGLERIRSRIDERAGRGFGWDRLTVGWGRPVLAVAAAVLIAGIGVTAPQTMDLIQSTGSNGPSEKGRHGTSGGDPAGPQGMPPGSQPPASATPSESGDPTAPGSPSPTTSMGSVACGGTRPGPDTPTAAASPAPSGAASDGSTPTCASGSPSTSPSSPSPPDPGPTQSGPTGPTDPPTTGEQPETGGSDDSTAG